VIAQARYLPYGEERWGTGVLPTDFGYTGQRSEGFGLYDYNARYYSPGLGRFVSADTIVPEPANPQNFNRYAYGLNNPLRYTDPSGHQGEPWWEQVIRGIHGWVCGGWNSISGCPGDILLKAFDALPERSAPEDMAGPLLIDPEELDAVEAAQEGMEQAEELGQMVPMTPPVNSRGEPYPEVEVEGYGKVPFPNGPITVTDPQPLRDEYTSELRKEFRDQWYDKYGWYPSSDKYEIHHIKPLSRGGANDFDNLVPLKIETEDQEEQHQQFTNWWHDYP
jgi:RHS repeat-associated protein